MVVTCLVPKCKSGYKTKKKKLSMFKVPRDIEMRKKWKAAIPGIVAFKKSHTICEKHFEAHYIIRSYIKHDANGKIIANVPFQRPRLHSSAVPTIFDHTSSIYNKVNVPELVHTTESHQSIIGTSNEVTTKRPRINLASDEVTTKRPRIDLASNKVATKRPCIDFGDKVVHVELSSSCDQQKSSEIAPAEIGVSMSVNDRSFLTFGIDQRVIYDEKIDRFEAWKNALKTEKITSYTRVCSRHFQKEDYILPDVAKTRHLKTTAVPSCNLPSSAKRKTPSVAEADEVRLQKQIRRKILRKMEKSMQIDRDTENNESTDPLKSVELPLNVTNSEINTEMIHCHQIKEEPMDNNEGQIETYNEEGVCSGNTEYYCHQIKKEPTDNNEGQTESYNEEGVCSGNIEYCEDNKDFVFINVGKINETEGYKQEDACNETIEYCEDNKDLVSINIDNVEKTEGHVKKDMHNQSIGHSETKNLVDGTLNSTKKGERSETKKDKTQGNILTGRFPVNFSFMWSEIHRTFKEHTRIVDCEFKYWKLVHYTHRGLRTEFFFKCQRCLYEASVWSDPINFEEIERSRTRSTAKVVHIFEQDSEIEGIRESENEGASEEYFESESGHESEEDVDSDEKEESDVQAEIQQDRKRQRLSCQRQAQTCFNASDDDAESDYEQVESEGEGNNEEEAAAQSAKEKGSMAYLRGKDGFAWSTKVPNLRGRRQYAAALKGRAHDVTTPLEAWSLLFTDEMLHLILKHTNEQINRVTAKLRRNYEFVMNYHKAVDLTELKALIGLLYFAGLYKLNMTKTRDLWTPYGSSLFRITMGNNRFNFLLNCMRFDDRSTREQRKATDRFTHIREIWNMFIFNCTAYYEPGSNCTIDEQLLSFRGKCSFKMYMPAKPDKYGLKVVLINDAKTHYMFNAIPYVGAVDKEPAESVPSYYVRKLAEPIYGTGRNITCNNWFSSIPIFDKMKTEYNLTMVGTIRKNKREIPNKTKGGTDSFDKKCHDFTTARKTFRWPMRYFYGMLDQANVNSFILYTFRQDNSKKKRQDYILDLSLALIKSQLQRRLTEQGCHVLTRLQIKEFLTDDQIPEDQNSRDLISDNKMSTRKRCSYCPCALNRKTWYKCLKCNNPMCNGHAAKICNTCSVTII